MGLKGREGSENEPVQNKGPRGRKFEGHYVFVEGVQRFPYAPCMVYLPTFGIRTFMVNVGKYSLHGACGIHNDTYGILFSNLDVYYNW